MAIPQFPIKPIKLGQFIGGEWHLDSTSTRPVISPYNQMVIGQLTEFPLSEMKRTVAKSLEAHTLWSQTPLKERCRLLFDWRDVLIRDLESMSHIVASESGKTPNEAQAGLLKGIEVLEFATSMQNLDLGGHMEVSRGVTCAYRREPLGVVLGITPFNFPAMVPMWMIPLALVAGNAFIWKPSDQTPLISKWLIESFREVGFPPGILSVVHGGAPIAEAFIEHPQVKAVAFVGSTPIAKSVYSKGTLLGKRVLALGGAKNHIILLPDADPVLAAKGIADSFTGCAGQRCMAASVLIAVGDCDNLLQAILEQSKKKMLGEDMGAIINQTSLHRMLQALARAEEEGGKIVLDGRKMSPPKGCENGFWLGPTIVDHVSPHSQLATEELFGPILSILRVQTLSEALAIEKSNIYGNATSVFTQSGGMAERVTHEAKAAMVGVNIGVPVPREPFSFGGTAASKFGHGDITGIGGIDFWSQLKKITTKWQSQPDQSWMG